MRTIQALLSLVPWPKTAFVFSKELVMEKIIAYLQDHHPYEEDLLILLNQLHELENLLTSDSIKKKFSSCEESIKKYLAKGQGADPEKIKSSMDNLMNSIIDRRERLASQLKLFALEIIVEAELKGKIV